MSKTTGRAPSVGFADSTGSSPVKRGRGTVRRMVEGT